MGNGPTDGNNSFRRIKMTVDHLTRRNAQAGAIIWTAALFLALLTAAGCSTMSKVAQVTKDLSPIDLSGDEKIKKIGVMGFEKRVRIPFADFSPTADRQMVETMSEDCSDILTVFPDSPDYPSFLRHPPRRVDGQIDALALARRGRQNGFNAVVTGGLVDIDGYREERGFLWFKDNESFIKLLMKMEAYDTRTGAKFIDRLLAREINTEEIGTPPTGNTDIGDPVLINAVRELVSELAEGVCEALEDRPWVGYVTAVDGKRVVLSSGSAQGLAPGDVFDVFDSTGTIQGAAGERFFQIGPKTGEVTLTSVTPDRAEGVAEGHVTPGCSLALK
jgi:hypothetical protein